MAEFDQPETNFRKRSIRIAVWDLPTRLFHWSLVILIALAWWSGEEEWFDVHFWAGSSSCS